MHQPSGLRSGRRFGIRTGGSGGIQQPGLRVASPSPSGDQRPASGSGETVFPRARKMTEKALPERGFPDAEFVARAARAQAMMAERDLDALLVCTEPEVRYLTGFHTPFWQSPTRPWFVILPVAGRPVAVIPGIGASAMGTTWVTDIRTWPAPRSTDDGLARRDEHLGMDGRRAGEQGTSVHRGQPTVVEPLGRAEGVLSPATQPVGLEHVADLPPRLLHVVLLVAAYDLGTQPGGHPVARVEVDLVEGEDLCHQSIRHAYGF